STSLQARPTRPALLLSSILFFLITRRLPGSTLFPYTTLFRSRWAHNGNRKVLALPRQNRFAQALRERISVGPTQVLRAAQAYVRSEEHTSELQSRFDLVCRLLLEKKKNNDTASVNSD